MTYVLTAVLFLSLGFVIGLLVKPADNPWTRSRKDEK